MAAYRQAAQRDRCRGVQKALAENVGREPDVGVSVQFVGLDDIRLDFRQVAHRPVLLEAHDPHAVLQAQQVFGQAEDREPVALPEIRADALEHSGAVLHRTT